MRLRVGVAFVAALLLLPIDAFSQGTVLWQLQQDVGGGLDDARAITLSGNAAIVVGNSEGEEDGEHAVNLFIEAVNRRTGAVQWSDQAFLSPSTVEPLFLTKQGTGVFAVGTRREPGQVASAFFVRGYDVPTGAFLWENVWNPSTGAVDTDHPTGIVASATAVVVFGYGRNQNGTGLAFLTRAFDRATGTVLWEDNVGADDMDFIPRTADINRNRLFLAGTTSPVSDPQSRSLLVRAYDLGSGEVKWELDRPGVSPVQVALAGGQLFVAGESTLSGATTTYLGAFSPRSGNEAWENPAPLFGRFVDLAVDGGHLVGAVSNTAGGFAVQLYDLDAGGTLLWQDITAAAPGTSETARAVALNDGAVYLAGSGGPDFQPTALTVRAYAVANGALLWDDRYRAVTPATASASAVDIKVGKRRMFVAGNVSDTRSGPSDIVIRAYDIRADSTTN